MPKKILALGVLAVGMSTMSSFARIGGTSAEFQRSGFAKALGLVLKSSTAAGDAFYGKGEVLVVVFKANDGRITRQRLKWLGNKYPDVKAMSLVYLTFCMEATATKQEDADCSILINRLTKAMAENGTFVFKGYKILVGELDAPDQGISGDLVIEVSK